MAGDVVFALAVMAMAGMSLYFGPQIRTATVPMQWGLNGRPTWFAPKLAGLWGPVGFALLVRLFMAAAASYAPDKIHHAALGLLVLSVVLPAAHFGFLLGARRWASRQV